MISLESRTKKYLPLERDIAGSGEEDIEGSMKVKFGYAMY